MKKELIVEFDPKNPISEIFRTLRTNIQFMNTKKNLKSILVTSTIPEEGKTWTAANLAISFAQNDKKVILIDGDMRKGRLYSLFGAKPRPGLSNYLSGIDEIDGKVNLNNYIQHTEIGNLDVIVAGNIPPNPSELINSDEMVDLLEKLKLKYDLVVVDGTPCNLVADSIILSRIVDKTIVIGAYGITRKEQLNSTITQIKNVGGSIAGVVLNRVPETIASYRKNGYYSKGPKDRVLASSKLKKEQAKNKLADDLQKSRLQITNHEISEHEHLEKFKKTDKVAQVKESKPVKIKNIPTTPVVTKTVESKQEETRQEENKAKDFKNNKHRNKKNFNKKNSNNKGKRAFDSNNAGTTPKNTNTANTKRSNANEILQEIDNYLKEEKKKIK